MKKNTIKIILDVLLLLAVGLFYSKNTISMKFHEVGGLVLCGVFLIHISLNIPWLKAVPRRLLDKNLPAKTKIGFAINLLLVICFAVIALSGVMISKTILTGISGQSPYWKVAHYFCAALTVFLLGIHIGLHVPFLKGMAKKFVRLPQRVGAGLLAVFLLAAVVFGSYNLATTGVSRWLSMPFQTSSMPSGGQHEGGGMPENADGTRPSSTDGGSHGAGKGNGGPSEGGKGMQSPSVSRAVQQSATFGSMILTFSVLTGAICWLIQKKRSSRQL